jgi:hypothetical protein
VGGVGTQDVVLPDSVDAGSLALLKCKPTIASSGVDGVVHDRETASRVAKGRDQQLEVWAQHNAVVFESRAAIVAAEIGRIEGRVLDAQGLYEKALRSAHARGFVHVEAIANERAGFNYASRGFEKFAST